MRLLPYELLESSEGWVRLTINRSTFYMIQIEGEDSLRFDYVSGGFDQASFSMKLHSRIDPHERPLEEHGPQPVARLLFPAQRSQNAD